MKKSWPARILGVFFALPLALLLFGLVFIYLKPSQTQAQVAQTSTGGQDINLNFESLGIASYINLPDFASVPDGSIIAHFENRYGISQGVADKNMVGVYDTEPALAFEPELTNDLVPIITTGVVEVLVNNSGGAIQAGDSITSSSTPGVGMRASKSGFILGVAQENYDSAEAGQIPVLLDIKFAYGADSPDSERITSRLLTILSASSIAALEDPAVAFRTLVGSLILVLSLIIAFITFARIAQKGIDALGRNPLAGRMIGVGIVLNVAVSILIILGGIAGAYFVINFGG